MALDAAKNFAKVTVSTGYDDSATTVVLSASEGAKLPTASFNAVWYNATDYTDPTDDPNREIIRVTDVTTDTLTVTRGQEDTTAKTHNTGGKTYKLIAGLTAKVINTDIPGLVPVKASGAEITTGTDDAKFATPKAISDAGLVLDSDGTLAADSDVKVATQKATKTYVDTSVAAATSPFWKDVPGTPTRVSDTQFTITDASNANLYDQIFKKGVIIKWLESTTFQTAMVISSSYATNTVTINIVGDSLTAGFSSMKYCVQMAEMETFIIAGTFPSAATTDLSKTLYLPNESYILSADLYVKTAGTGTGSNVVDINSGGTTKFTTKPTVTTGTSDIDNVADNPSTAIAAGTAITIDVDSVTATTAPTDGYVYLFYYPVSWRYRS